ncbi:MAG: molybdopterin-synthase adenylyltransferase MoeB [Rhodospirillales bacterium]|nr:HesA/MoeB/ThiF family protein [Alphaproteobacteria bacterium]MCB9986819.1 molybdopterin-synthase adenylyltransferase MoeB [Rhodospirillales bacterium]USO08416.1 MAG: HesA/MoeB/ThiF family protein [Rhodospirillales bacterium]
MNTLASHRYQRQVVLSEIGPEGQSKLAAARILCVGAGGLGCPALMYLAAAGVGHITIIDPDTVDLTNLQRQVLFTVEDCGQSKAIAAQKRLQQLNPDIEVEAIADWLTDKNAKDLFLRHDIIIDGTDNFETKYLINDAAIKTSKPVVYGAIQGFEGQVSVWSTEHGPCYRCLYPTPPKAAIRNCAEAGVIGAVAGVIGTTQAMQCITLIVDHASFAPLIGKLWIIDMKTMDTQSLSITKKHDCLVCAQDKADIKLTYNNPECSTVQISQLDELPANGSYTLIDVREKTEWDNGHIKSAILCPLSDIEAGKLPDLPVDTDLVLYCQKGVRSLKAAQIIATNGFVNIRSLRGGYEAWLTKAKKETC